MYHDDVIKFIQSIRDIENLDRSLPSTKRALHCWREECYAWIFKYRHAERSPSLQEAGVLHANMRKCHMGYAILVHAGMWSLLLDYVRCVERQPDSDRAKLALYITILRFMINSLRFRALERGDSTETFGKPAT